MNMLNYFDNSSTAATSAPNRCNYNKNNSSRCKQAVTRNLDGTWSKMCQQHKDYYNKWNTTARASKKPKAARKIITCDSSSEDADDDIKQLQDAGICSLCDGPSRPKKNGHGFTKYCDKCTDDTSLIYKSIMSFKRARHAVESMGDPDELLAKKQKLEQELAAVSQELDAVKKYYDASWDALEKAKSDLDKLM